MGSLFREYICTLHWQRQGNGGPTRAIQGHIPNDDGCNRAAVMNYTEYCRGERNLPQQVASWVIFTVPPPWNLTYMRRISPRLQPLRVTPSECSSHIGGPGCPTCQLNQLSKLLSYFSETQDWGMEYKVQCRHCTVVLSRYFWCSDVQNTDDTKWKYKGKLLLCHIVITQLCSNIVCTYVKTIVHM